MSFVVVIPSRMTSTRLPKKPLKDICGKPMVVRVAERAAASGAERVVVAADSEEIINVVTENGFEGILTDPNHPTGTDRIAEAVQKMGLADDAIVVNVQGDEPLIEPAVIRQVAELLEHDTESTIATAAHPIADAESFFNPNVVKVELDSFGRAMTFTRAPVPWPRDAFAKDRTHLPEGFTAYHHVGLYAYRALFLKRFSTLTRAPIERFESLEQLRAMWHGYKIAVAILEGTPPAGVDTAEDLERVRSVFKKMLLSD